MDRGAGRIQFIGMQRVRCNRATNNTYKENNISGRKLIITEPVITSSMKQGSSGKDTKMVTDHRLLTGNYLEII